MQGVARLHVAVGAEMLQRHAQLALDAVAAKEAVGGGAAPGRVVHPVAAAEEAPQAAIGEGAHARAHPAALKEVHAQFAPRLHLGPRLREVQGRNQQVHHARLVAVAAHAVNQRR